MKTPQQIRAAIEVLKADISIADDVLDQMLGDGEITDEEHAELGCDDIGIAKAIEALQWVLDLPTETDYLSSCLGESCGEEPMTSDEIHRN